MGESFKGKVLPLAPVEFYVTLRVFPNVKRKKKKKEKENKREKKRNKIKRIKVRARVVGSVRAFRQVGTFDGKQFVRSRVAWKAPRCN